MRYFALFNGRCLNGRWESATLGTHDLVILCCALFNDMIYSLGSIIARHLHTNRIKGVIYGDIYATFLASHFNVDIRYREDSTFPRVHPNYERVKEHDFVNGGEPRY